METRETRYRRQADLIDSSIYNVPITVVGAGSVGSFTALALAKCGLHDITVYDFDVVEEHNIPNQFYPLSAVGVPKVEALKELIKSFEGIDISCVERAFTDVDTADGVIVSAVDSMEARKLIFNSVYRNPRAKVLIDARMGGQQIEIYTCNLRSAEDKKAYIKTLKSDDEVSDARCTEKAIIYNVLVIAGLIVNQVRRALSDMEYQRLYWLHLDTLQTVER